MIKKLLFHLVRVVVPLFLSYPTWAANSMTITAPTIVNAAFTVTTTGQCIGTAATCWVEQRIGTGAWMQVSGTVVGAGGVPPAFSRNLAVGTYSYRAVDLSFNGISLVTTYSTEGPVTVITGPVPVQDSMANQSRYTYQTRVGDINGDGKQDLYIARTAGGMSGSGVIEKLILPQGTGGAFTPVVPTSAQVTTASSWPTSAVELVLQDFNLDGYVDIVARNIGSVIANTVGQIILSSGQLLNTNALGLIPMGTRFQKIVNEVDNFTEDPNYYYNNAVVRTFTIATPVMFCTFTPGLDYYAQQLVYCGYFLVAANITVRDYSAFDRDALRLRNVFQTVVNGVVQAVLDPGTALGKEADSAWLSAFGYRVLRGMLDTGCTTVYAYGASGEDVPCDRRYWPLFMFSLIKNNANNSCRPVTFTEQALAQSNGLNIVGFPNVKICNRPYTILGFTFGITTSFVMSPDGNVYIPSTATAISISSPLSGQVIFLSDYTATPPFPYVGTELRGLLLHELTHVYQHNNRGCFEVCMWIKAIAANGNYIYMPIPSGTVSFSSYNIEQQAEMVEDRYRLNQGLNVAITGPGGIGGNAGASANRLNEVISL